MDPEPNLLNITSYTDASVLPDLIKPFTFDLGISIVILILMLAISALISGAEVAFFSLDPAEVKKMDQSEKKSDRSLFNLLSDPKMLLATILIANNFINIGIVILSSYLILGIVHMKGLSISVKDTLEGLFNTQFELSTVETWVSFSIGTVCITFILLLFGEILPKVYANRYSLKFSQMMARPVSVIKTIFHFPSKMLVATSGVIDKSLANKNDNISVDDLSNALELTSDDNTNTEEQKILEGIVTFGNTDVKQIMCSRVDVSAIDISLDFAEVVEQILECGFSRIPVYNDTFDTVKGILYIKDLLPYLKYKNDFKWTVLIREPFYVPANKKIDDLLKEFQERKIHMAIVVDEYGGTLGIVTLEDIIEEIVGDINDEFDHEDIIYSKLDEKNYIFEGKTPMNDFYRILDINGDEFDNVKGESDTMAGFILEQFGKIPTKGEQTRFNEYLFTVDGISKRRITRIKVSLE